MADDKLDSDGERGDDAVATVRAWLAAWGDEVAGLRFADAEQRFADGVVAFGTLANTVRGLPALRRDQWEHVWPAIDGFAFDADGADVWVSADATQAVIATAWTSLGNDPTGATFSRGGRATVLLTKTGAGTWIGQHTHFSLQPIDPGTTLVDRGGTGSSAQ